MLAYRPTLRVAIAVPFAILFAAAVGLQAFTEHQQVNALIDRSSVRLLDMLTSSAASRLSDYLEEPFRIQREVGAAITRQSMYHAGDLSPIYRHIRSAFHDSYQDLQQISVIGFGSRAGEYVGLRREEATKGLALMLKDRSTKGQLVIYKGEGPGLVNASFANYDPRARPWYTPVAQSGQSRWSDIYTNFDERSGVTISATSPVRAGGDLLGVMAVDVKLDGLSHFLRDELTRGKGTIVITDVQGRLVAQSEIDSVVSNGQDGGQRGERLLMSQSANAAIRAAAQPVARAFLDTEVDFALKVEGQPYFGRVTPFNDVRGLHWRIVALVPESDLMGDARLVSQHVMLWILGLSALGLFLGLWVVSWVTRPIQRTAQAANRLALGQGNVGIAQSGWLRETSILVAAFNDMAQRLHQSFSELREQLIYDKLTGLLTRRGLLEQAQWSGSRQAAIALVGLDGFRAINDKVGYGAGDHLLRAIAQRFNECFAAPVLVARVSGDEFALLQFEMSGDQSSMALGERALTLFVTPFSFGADEVTVSASAGVVQGLLETQALPEWLRKASVALGEAKRRGQGRCVRFEADMMAQFLAKAQLINELRQALEQEQFLVYFQPVVHLASGRVAGAEALLRWQSPQRGMVSPGVFIPLAEESDLILALGDWVLRSATRQMAQQLSQLPADFELHVNLSPRQLIQSDFVSSLQRILDDSAYPASKLTLELTESQLIDPGMPIEERLQAIRAMGVKIAIDDFGTGYSSLAYLSRLPFNCLKIDQSFVRKLASSRPDAAIVQAVLHMAHGLGVQVVAEGVETVLEARLLHQMGCGYVQGYYFARPSLLAQCDWQDRKAISVQ